jgi:hypothetical protein
MDDQMQASMGGDMEIEWRLEAYASVRLSPSARAAARMRTRVMRDARFAFDARAAAPAPLALIDSVAARRRSGLIRRGSGILLAATLSLGVAGGAMAAAQAGGPLYASRMWLETVTLPTTAAERTDAEITRLDARMIEVLAAARRGDPGAVQAALLAYEEIADEAVTAAGDDANAADRLRIALDRHLAVLATVAAKVPAQARDSIQANVDRAIERGGATVERMQGNHGAPWVKPGGSGTDPAVSPKPEKSPKPNATPGHTPDPHATPKPHPTPHAQPPAGGGKPPKAEPTPKADKTPPGQSRRSSP